MLQFGFTSPSWETNSFKLRKGDDDSPCALVRRRVGFLADKTGASGMGQHLGGVAPSLSPSSNKRHHHDREEVNL